MGCVLVDASLAFLANESCVSPFVGLQMSELCRIRGREGLDSRVYAPHFAVLARPALCIVEVNGLRVVERY